MGYLPALGGKAAHLVSDLATVILNLNPASERERQRHHPSHLPAWNFFIYSVSKKQALCWLLTSDSWGSKRSSFWWFGRDPTAAYHKKRTNDCFVFTNVDGRPVICHPTGANNYFTFCSTDYLTMGGGCHLALYLDGDLVTGSSSTSETFNNPCLSHTQEFKIKDVELWGFVNASKYEEMVTVKQGIWNL